MPTRKQKKEFEESIFEDSSLLEKSIEWIKDNMGVHEVFEESEIESWVTNNRKPESVFSREDLEQWAEDNGYKKEE